MGAAANSGTSVPVQRDGPRRLHPLLPPRPIRAVVRGLAMLARPDRPLLAQLVVTRRCNLACGYCNEYDDFSAPVPIAVLLERVDHLAGLGTFIVTLTGGEPLLHPQIEQIAERVTAHGMVCTMISNGYPLTLAKVRALNRTGLSLLQLSVDNREPNAVSHKSFSKIRDKLALLRDHARFAINVNAVLGSSGKEETRQLVAEIRAYGFYMTVGLLHDEKGQIDGGLLGDDLPAFYREMRQLCRKSAWHRPGEGWEEALLSGDYASFRCRAGARYLYVGEDGRVSYCSQRRNDPGTDLLAYGRQDTARAFALPKGCEARCTIACVRRASALDEWRGQAGR
jgi:MoaA/NifB/PqqE/SkfB family radical SAM enzyme